MYAIPRSPVVMEGSPGANMVVSLIITASQASRCWFCWRNLARFGEPTSSSPSMTKTTLAGRVPPSASSACTALTCRYTWPLSSTEPRANRLPSRTSGSNGALFHSSSGSAGCTS